jgi:TPR repeat protein
MRLFQATKRETQMAQELVLGIEEYPAQEVARLEQAAAAGDGDAACRLGDLYAKGRAASGTARNRRFAGTHAVRSRGMRTGRTTWGFRRRSGAGG